MAALHKAVHKVVWKSDRIRNPTLVAQFTFGLNEPANDKVTCRGIKAWRAPAAEFEGEGASTGSVSHCAVQRRGARPSSRPGLPDAA
eukprot:6187634-Pleurochrysis_carterae.AAC.1